MAASAPRYSRVILELAEALDDPRRPMAETCRRVAAAAEQFGLPRPSYVHLRRFLKDQRAAKVADAAERERRRLRVEAAIAGLLAGRVKAPLFQLIELLEQ